MEMYGKAECFGTIKDFQFTSRILFSLPAQEQCSDREHGLAVAVSLLGAVFQGHYSWAYQNSAGTKAHLHWYLHSGSSLWPGLFDMLFLTK